MGLSLVEETTRAVLNFILELVIDPPCHYENKRENSIDRIVVNSRMGMRWGHILAYPHPHLKTNMC